MRLLRAASYAAVPWKNGGGITHEIARSGDEEPPGWRLSVATIDRDGPFSDFTGCDRTIVPIEGAGFVLSFEDGRQVRLDAPFEPFEFAGEARVTCALVAGRSRDFNAITRRDLRTHAVRRFTVSAVGGPISLSGDAFVYAGDAVTVSCAGTEFLVEAGDTLDVPEPATLLFHAVGERANLLIVIFRRS